MDNIDEAEVWRRAAYIRELKAQKAREQNVVTADQVTYDIAELPWISPEEARRLRRKKVSNIRTSYCAYCGDPYIRTSANQRFCTIQCRIIVSGE